MVMTRSAQAQDQATTRIVPAGEFKAKCLQLMDEVNQKDLTLIITKRGKPVMRASAATEEKPFRPLWGRSPNVKILGDIMTPLDWPDPTEKWKRANASKPARPKRNRSK
jgi:antitoxin (DNA-binding transcriptional repressor) of toxin-antitoxin stability system